MSETTPTFTDAKGSEANQHAKKIAQAKSRSQKNKTSYPVFYVQEGFKVLSLTFKPRGVYRNYIGNVNKKGEGPQIKAMLQKWQEQGLLLFPHQIEQKAQELAPEIAKLEKKK